MLILMLVMLSSGYLVMYGLFTLTRFNESKVQKVQSSIKKEKLLYEGKTELLILLFHT